MNESTELNSELLSADARGRKHIPVAVFAVILIHVVLFVVLLIAAGCRSSARVKATQPGPERGVHPTQQYMHAGAGEGAAGPMIVSSGEKVVVMEPLTEGEDESVVAQVAPQRRIQLPARNEVLEERRSQTAATVVSGSRGRSPSLERSGSPGREAVYYVVQSGDTVGEIAQKHGTTVAAIKAANKLKNHLIYPGQKLLVKPGSSGSTAQVNPKRSRNDKV